MDTHWCHESLTYLSLLVLTGHLIFLSCLQVSLTHSAVVVPVEDRVIFVNKTPPLTNPNVIDMEDTPYPLEPIPFSDSVLSPLGQVTIGINQYTWTHSGNRGDSEPKDYPIYFSICFIRTDPIVSHHFRHSKALEIRENVRIRVRLIDPEEHVQQIR